jgi:hypothetical protein
MLTSFLKHIVPTSKKEKGHGMATGKGKGDQALGVVTTGALQPA